MLHAVSSRERQLQSSLNSVLLHKQEYQRRSTVDGLTGVFNRAYFEEMLSEALAGAKKNTRSVALGLIDCDGFKRINDTHGHQVGDEILCLLGSILKSAVREGSDIPFRYGGDEFGVILGGIEQERLQEISDKVLRQFEQGTHLGATLSIGAIYCRGGCCGYPDKEEFKRLADEALYEAKHRGKNRIVIKPFPQCVEGLAGG